MVNTPEICLSGKRIFFSGICGISVSSLALLSKEAGCLIMGSDIGNNPQAIRELNENGIKVIQKHSSENVHGSDIFVHTSAVTENNPELVEAKRLGLPTYTRAEFMQMLMSEYGNRIGISGTHGKSTVSGMLTHIISMCGCDCTALIGARFAESGKAYRLGKSDTVIFEACEYKRSFLNFRPTVATVLNIEKDHTDCYQSLEDSVEAFKEYAKKAKICVLNYDDLSVRKLKDITSKPFFFSSNNEKADIYMHDLKETGGLHSFVAVTKKGESAEVKLSVPGIHNAVNALAAVATAYALGYPLDKCASAVSSFRGMKRRFEHIGSCGDAEVYDDYAHHPTEIKTALDTARRMEFSKIVCAFQPHTYSRTKDLFDEFIKAFEYADEVFIADIYAAREKNTFGVTSKMLADSINGAEYVPELEEMADKLRKFRDRGTVILTIGAGELDRVAEKVVDLRKN